jgi:hypothetical protein
MKVMAVLAVGCGLIAAPLLGAGDASATPSSCDGADCVPNVARGVSQGAECDARTRYDFGLDSASGATLVCSATGKWTPTRPLVGVRPEGAPCYGSSGSAQSPDGIPMACDGAGWNQNYTDIFYASPV